MRAYSLHSTLASFLVAIGSLTFLAPQVYSHDLQICKQTDSIGPISGTFHFTVGSIEIAVDVGKCRTISEIGVGTFTVIEEAVTGTIVSNIAVSGAGSLISSDTATRSATVTVVEGGTTTVTFTNRATLNGRFTGGGSIFTTSGARVTHGFELYCSTAEGPNNLEVNVGGDNFHLDTLTSVACSYNSSTGVATITGTGTGSYNNTSGASIVFTFTDAGEPGTGDFASYLISDSGGSIVLNASGNLTFGNQQFHPAKK